MGRIRGVAQGYRFADGQGMIPEKRGVRVRGTGRQRGHTGYVTQVEAGEPMPRGTQVTTDASGRAVQAREGEAIAGETIEDAPAENALVRVRFS